MSVCVAGLTILDMYKYVVLVDIVAMPQGSEQVADNFVHNIIVTKFDLRFCVLHITTLCH